MERDRATCGFMSLWRGARAERWLLDTLGRKAASCIATAFRGAHTGLMLRRGVGEFKLSDFIIEAGGQSGRSVCPAGPAGGSCGAATTRCQRTIGPIKPVVASRVQALWYHARHTARQRFPVL